MAVVGLLAGFFGRELDFVGVDHDNVVARIDVRREFGLVLAAQTAAISVARRPSTLSLPSTTYQSRLTSGGLAEKVFIIFTNGL